MNVNVSKLCDMFFQLKSVEPVVQEKLTVALENFFKCANSPPASNPRGDEPSNIMTLGELNERARPHETLIQLFLKNSPGVVPKIAPDDLEQEYAHVGPVCYTSLKNSITLEDCETYRDKLSDQLKVKKHHSQKLLEAQDYLFQCLDEYKHAPSIGPSKFSQELKTPDGLFEEKIADAYAQIATLRQETLGVMGAALPIEENKRLTEESRVDECYTKQVGQLKEAVKEVPTKAEKIIFPTQQTAQSIEEETTLIKTSDSELLTDKKDLFSTVNQLQRYKNDLELYLEKLDTNNEIQEKIIVLKKEAIASYSKTIALHEEAIAAAKETTKMCAQRATQYEANTASLLIICGELKKIITQSEARIARKEEGIALLKETIAHNRANAAFVVETAAKVNAHADRVDAIADRVDAIADRVKGHADRVDAIADQVKAHANHVNARADRVKAHADRVDAIADRVKAHANHVNARADHVDAIADRVDAIADRVKAHANDVDATLDRFDVGAGLIKKNIADMGAIAMRVKKRSAYVDGNALLLEESIAHMDVRIGSVNTGKAHIDSRISYHRELIKNLNEFNQTLNERLKKSFEDQVNAIFAFSSYRLRDRRLFVVLNDPLCVFINDSHTRLMMAISFIVQLIFLWIFSHYRKKQEVALPLNHFLVEDKVSPNKAPARVSPQASDPWTLTKNIERLFCLQNPVGLAQLGEQVVGNFVVSKIMGHRMKTG